jgi:hypothetical protein
MASTDGSGEWVFLTYSLPRDPSAPRLALWRKLRRLGVAQLADGLVCLPDDARTREQLEWAADDVLAAGGSAAVWLARAATRAQEREVAQAMNRARADEYLTLTQSARDALVFTLVDRRRALRRRRADNARIRRRDFFRPAEREHARQALAALAATVAPAATASELEVSS